jgi:4-amino-4-deoxy-L-arabinose transferase-like glycosyltransferase
MARSTEIWPHSLVDPRSERCSGRPRGASHWTIFWYHSSGPDNLQTVSMIPARRYLFWLLICGIAVRVGLLASIGNAPVHTDDEKDYVALAGSLMDGRGFALANRPTSIRPPLYPAFIAAVWSVAPGRSYISVRACQIALSVISVLLVYYLGRELFNPRVGRVAAAIWCFYPSFLFAGVLLLTEVLFTTLLLGACACGVAVIRSDSRKVYWAAGCGLCVAFGALTRSVLWPMPLALAPALAAVSSPTWRVRALVAFALMTAYLTAMAPWSIRNTRLQQTFVVVDTMGGMNLRMGNFEHTIEDRMWDGVSLTGEKSWSYQMVLEHPEARAWTEGQREQWARERALQFMRDHPLITLKRSIRKFADFWGLEREYIAALQRGVYAAPPWWKALSSSLVLGSYVAVAILACFGLFNSRWGDWRLHIPALLAIFWVCALHSVVFGHSRYHLPVMPFVVIYAAAALHQRAWRGSGRTYRGRTALTACACLMVIWAFEVLVRDAARLRQLAT